MVDRPKPPYAGWPASYRKHEERCRKIDAENAERRHAWQREKRLVSIEDRVSAIEEILADTGKSSARNGDAAP